MSTKTNALDELLDEGEVMIDLDREYTLEEFVQLPDDGNHYELIDGKLIMSPPPRDDHGTVASILYDAIKDYLKKQEIGKLWFNVGFNVGVKSNGKPNVLEPDLGFILANRVPKVSSQYLPYPDLAIEVWSRDSDLADSSKLKKARKKLQMYLNAGASLAWGINPLKKEVEVYHKEGPTQTLRINDELDGENVLPGFKFPVRSLFEN